MNKLLILLFCYSSIAFGQENKLKSFLGADFYFVTPTKGIPYMEKNPDCEIVRSISVQGDTSGLVYKNEFVLFRNNEVLPESSMKDALQFVKASFVSNKEYQEYQKWVRDSTCREHIYSGIESDEYALQWLNIPSKNLKNIDQSRRDKNRRTYSLNWEKKFSYDDLNLMPLFADQYIPRNQRFYRCRDFDERKNLYHYKIEQNEKAEKLDFLVATLSHESFWAKESGSINDETSVLGQTYDRLLPDLPLIGITGMQANAFCHWKEIQLQQELNKQKLPYFVRVTLPAVTESANTPKTLTVPVKNYSSNWKITVEDYQLFVAAVRDSLFKERLFLELETDESATKFLQTKKLYLDEDAVEIVELEPSDRDSNRKQFDLTENNKILQKYKTQIKDIETRYSDSLYYFTYYRMDIRSKTILGDMITQPGYAYYTNEKEKGHYILFYMVSETDKFGYPVGMDLNLDNVNQLRQGTGVRGHKKYESFIIREIISVKSEIPLENQKQEAFVKGITYEQALAYYHWKYPVSKAKPGDEWQNLVYPNEEQFSRIQRGEQIIIPEHSLNFPSPVFRYVVTFVPKK